MKNSSRKPIVAHYVSKYLVLTENWIFRILINHINFYPIQLTRKKENLHLFPFKEIYALEDLGKVRFLLEILIFRIIGYFHYFKNVCVEKQVKILHVHFGYHGIKLHGLKRSLGIPMVCSFYGDDAFSYPTRPGGYREKYKVLFTHADKVLVLGPYMKNELKALGCPESKLMIHHLGVDVEKIEFKQRQFKRDEPIRFMTSSSFLEKKGIEIAIRALSALKERYDFRLELVGDGPLRPLLEEEVEKGGIKDRVIFHGYQPYEFVIENCYKCQVFIQASRTGKMNNKEGTPMAIVDAMATGMPVVSTWHSDIPEIVHDGVVGYLARENDVESLKTCFESFFEKPEKIADFSLAARSHIEKEFNSRILNERLEALYNDLLK